MVDTTSPLPRATPESQGVPSGAIARMVACAVAHGRGRANRHTVAFGQGIWVDGESFLESAEAARVAVGGGWRLAVKADVGFGPTERPVLIGVRA